jgi:hypothetical protein
MMKAVARFVVVSLMVSISVFAHAEIIDLYSVADAEITGRTTGSGVNTHNWGNLLNLVGNVNKTGGPVSSPTTDPLYFPNTGDSRGLFKFDLSSIPAGATIDSATVSIYVNFNAFNLAPRISSVSLYEVTADWAELGVTYDTKPAWDTTPVSSMTVPTGTGPNQGGYNGYINGNVTNLVRDWFEGDILNFGLATSDTYTTAGLLRISARETAGITQDPRLRVTYTPVPEPATIILLSQLGGFAVLLGWWRRRKRD